MDTPNLYEEVWFVVLMRQIFKQPYVYFVLGVFSLYIALAIIIGGFPLILFTALRYAPLGTRIQIALSITFSIIIAGLVACNAVSAFIQYQRRNRVGNANALTGLGSLGGLAAGICPACISGLLPIVLGFFGVSFSFAVLPFQGLEVQAILVILLAWNYRYLARRE